MKIFKHTGESGSCIIISAVNCEIAEQFIRSKLDNLGLTEELLNVHEVEHGCTQSSIIHIFYDKIKKPLEEKMSDLKQDISDIIQDTVNIAEGNYGWGGQEYILTNIDKAVKLIIERINKETLRGKNDKIE